MLLSCSNRAVMPLLPRSLPRLCVALGFPNAGQLMRSAEREYKDGNTFLEVRLDYLTNPGSGLAFIEDFRRRYPDSYLLATCRHKLNHGGFAGTIDQQLTLLRDAAGAGATAVDVEIESAEKAIPAVSGLRQSTPLVVSYHNFRNTPALGPIRRRIAKVPADVYKVISTAVKPSDNLRIMEFVREGVGSTPLVAFAMSEMGMPTRVLATGAGCVYSYAAPDEAEGTAPGQISSKAMRGLYRCEKLKRQSKIYGVIADPVSHSKSPLIHNRALQSRRIDAVYLPFLIPSAQLSDWMKTAAALPVSGFSVTIPHKQRILRYLDVVEPIAKRIGAVNTVWRKGQKWRGTNTDVDGVLIPLGKHLNLNRASVLIAGYGGAARAAAMALCDAGSSVTITGRNLAGAQGLARVVRGKALSLEEAAKEHFDVLVHATPVGMAPRGDACLFPDRIPADVVLDMVYNPHDTVLLNRAAAQGATVIHGAEMLLEQAARQFEIWSGESAPRAVMAAALAGQLSAK
jgi:3-dehydroquinate dehydratase / shikimate dehydrogenase